MEAWETTISVVIFRTSLGIGITPYWLSGIKCGVIIEKYGPVDLFCQDVLLVTIGGIDRGKSIYYQMASQVRSSFGTSPFLKHLTFAQDNGEIPGRQMMEVGRLALNCRYLCPYLRHLKSSSPQMPVQDNETKAGIFPGKVIIVAGGK